MGKVGWQVAPSSLNLSAFQIALPLLPCTKPQFGRWVSQTDPIQKGHHTVDNLGAHAGGVSPKSLMGSQSTGHTQGLACSWLSSNGNHRPLIQPLLPTPGTEV